MKDDMKTDSPKRDSDSCATVLIVDDDSAQLDSLCRGMFIYGHICVKKRSIAEAIDFLNRPDAPVVDLLLTDITTRNSKGLKLIRHARDLYPNLPIIAVSGLNSSHDIELDSQVDVLVLRRPFNPDRLDSAIRDLVA